MTLDPLPTPRQLFRLYEAGKLSREEFHEAMAVHSRALVEEMEEARANPIATYLDGLVARRAARRLVRRHGEEAVRLVFVALAEVPGFPPANLLWNANHLDVPLHCFFRARREPTFRVLRLKVAAWGSQITVEYGAAKRADATREDFAFRRDRLGYLGLERRKLLP
ncbi:hypothetical protein BH23VER1_BH23VER1_23100 [soil metagenome]